MTSSETVAPAKTIRLLHGAFIFGIVMFAIVVHFLTRPAMAGETFPAAARNVLLGVSLAASALSLFVLRSRVPRRSREESADLYWTTATALALMAWMPLEAGALLGVVVYMLYGTPAGLAVAAVAVVGFLVLAPGRLERA